VDVATKEFLGQKNGASFNWQQNKSNYVNGFDFVPEFVLAIFPFSLVA
jgi:hypothetical protein